MGGKNLAPAIGILAMWISILANLSGCQQAGRSSPFLAATPVAELTQPPLEINGADPNEAVITLAQLEVPTSEGEGIETASEQTLIRHPEAIAVPLPAEGVTSGGQAQLVELGSSGGQPVGYYVGIAINNHPRVQAGRARIAAASNRAPQVSSLDDPVLSNSYYPISDQALQTAAGRAGNTLSIAQKYPWPEKRWTKSAIADRETQMAAAKLVQVELEVEEMVRLAYYELWFAVRAISITAENREIAAELVKLAETRYSAGGRQQDVLRAQLQVDSLDDRLIGLRRQKSVAQADLAALIQKPEAIGIEPTAEIPVEQVPAQLEALFAAAEECNPRLRESRLAVSRDRQKQQLACLNRYPDFTLGAGWQTITESDAVSGVANGHDNVNFMIGVTLPIWRDKINASIREASSEVTASAREFDDARDDAFRQIRRLSEQAYAADEQLRLYHERILPRAKRALQLAADDYRGKLVDFGEVTDGFTEVLVFELQVARTKAALAGFIAQLHRAVGCEVVGEAGGQI